MLIKSLNGGEKGMSEPYEPIQRQLCEQEKKELIREFLAKLDKIRIYCDEYDYSIPTPFWDLIEEYQKRVKE